MKSKDESIDLILVGDVHLTPGVSNERMLWLGRLVGDRKPDAVVQIGDMNDMESLSSYDKGKKSFEGRRYDRDIKNGKAGLQLFEDGLDEYNEVLRNKKLKTYKPKKYLTQGNHDEKRILRAINDDPKLDGIMSVADLGYEEFGWATTPFLEPLDINGVIFQHYFPNGMERPMGGENLGNALTKRFHVSCWQGHNHLLQIAVSTDARGKKLYSGSAGCYFEHKLGYASAQPEYNFWRGVIFLKGIKDGSIEDIELLSIETIKRNYK
jgi:hypothetical protein